MIYIFTLLSLLFLPILSFKEIKPKLCINCKYFVTDSNSKFGKCTLFPKETEGDKYMLVNGIIEDENIEYNYCVISRGSDYMCGKEGKMYKNKNIKKEQFKKEKA